MSIVLVGFALDHCRRSLPALAETYYRNAMVQQHLMSDRHHG